MSLHTNERADEPKGAVHSASAATAEGLGSPLPPSESLIVIEPSRSWVTPDLRDLWAHRELLYFLIWRDLKVRYRQTLLGAATWIIIQPFLMMLIFTLFFGLLVRVPSDGIPYPLFVYAGLFLWTFFSNAVMNSSNSIVTNSNLITKVYFPRLLIPLSIVGARLVDIGITFLILIGLTVYYEVAPTWSVVMIPVLMAMVALLALGIGTWLSAWNVKYRDVDAALPVLVQFWFFASPIIYPASLVPTNWQWLYFLNPMAAIIENFRAALFGLEFNWSALGISVITILTILVCSAYAFRRVEKSFADII